MANNKITESLKKVGSTISAGTSNALKTKDTLQLQFPSARSSGNDGNTSLLSVTDLYKNGLLFTAYDYTSRTSPDMISFRKKQLANPLANTKNSPSSMTGTNKAVANILLPRSRTDVDEVSHKFNDVGESVITKGNNTVSGAISNVASTALFGMLDSITSGIMADHNEQIYTTARSMYAGANNRIKTYRWELTPRTIQDLIEIIKIHKAFNYYSYGNVGNSNYAKDIKNEIDQAYDKVLNQFKDDKSQQYNSIMSEVTSFLTNVIVVSNPTIWFVKNFGNTTSLDTLQQDVFGPCQIQSISFDKAPSGEFQGLAIAPNMSSTYILEVTMREILTLSRSSLYSGGV